MRKLNKIWWNYYPGREIEVQWPVGETHKKSKYPMVLGFSADPNDHYREELETKVGRQGWDWDWRLTDNPKKLKIKFRKGKEKWATYFSLKWN